MKSGMFAQNILHSDSITLILEHIILDVELSTQMEFSAMKFHIRLELMLTCIKKIGLFSYYFWFNWPHFWHFLLKTTSTKKR